MKTIKKMLIAVICMTLFSATTLFGQKAAEQQLESNLKIYEKTWNDIVNNRNIDAINENNFTRDVTLIMTPENIVGIEAFKAYYQNFLTGFSNIDFTVNDAFGNGDKLVKQWTFKGIHTGDFFGIPATGKSVVLNGVTITRMKNGKIALEHDFFDNAIFMQQLGLISNPANVGIIDGLYKSFAKGDIPEVLSRLDPMVVWNEAEGNALADGNPYIGPDAVLDGVFSRIMGSNEYFNLKDIQLHDMSNNQVLATLRYDGKIKQNGTAYNAQAAHLYTLNDDGKITAFQQYVDTKKLADVEMVGDLQMITAENYYLPVSTKSSIAKAAYCKAALLGSQIQIKEANAKLDEAIEEDPNFFMAYALKIYYSPKKERAALIDQALAIDNQHFTEAEKNVREQLLVWDRDPKASVAKNLKALMAAYPDTPQAYHWAAANAAFNDKDDLSAIKYSLRLIALCPDFDAAYNTLGYSYLNRKEMKKAKSAFDNYLAVSPAKANPYDSMADYFMANEEYTKAAEYYDIAAEKGMASAASRAAKARETVSAKVQRR